MLTIILMAIFSLIGWFLGGEISEAVYAAHLGAVIGAFVGLIIRVGGAGGVGEGIADAFD